MTERMTWRREAPSVRSVANSRVRWATVIDSVLKITNEPTNSARAPKPRKKYRTKSRPWLVCLASAAACASLSRTSSEAGTSGCTARISSAVLVPSLAWMEMPSKTPCLCSSRWAVGMSKTASVAPPRESTSPKRATPVIS